LQKQQQGKVWRSLVIVFRLLTLVKIGLTRALLFGKPKEKAANL
jgi:hypothetical protein